MSSKDNDDDRRDGDDQGRDRDGVGGNEPDKGGAKKSGARQGGDKPSYEVGYKKTPKHSRVVEGQVLNPKGRPKGSNNKPKEASTSDVRKMILNEARRKVTVHEAKGPATLAMVEMAYRSLGLQSGRGSVRASRDYVLIARQAQREEAAERSAALRAIGEYKIQCEHERWRCARLGIKPPPFIIDPDSVIVGPEGVLGFRDAATEDEKALWEKQRAEWQQEVQVLKAQYEGARGRKRTRLKEEIALVERMLGIVEDALAGSRRAMWALDQGTVPDEED